jgi:hypothetical protein
MAGNPDQVNRLFRQSLEEEQNTLLGIHVLFYVAINTLWVILNMVYIPKKFRWMTYYPLVGWGLVLFAHGWFFVRVAESLCERREQEAQ